jgi:hypothetical protein
MDSDTLTYLQNSEVWNILEVYKLKIGLLFNKKYDARNHTLKSLNSQYQHMHNFHVID